LHDGEGLRWQMHHLRGMKVSRKFFGLHSSDPDEGRLVVIELFLGRMLVRMNTVDTVSGGPFGVALSADSQMQDETDQIRCPFVQSESSKVLI